MITCRKYRFFQILFVFLLLSLFYVSAATIYGNVSISEGKLTHHSFF